jgi:hypothetical protein
MEQSLFILKAVTHLIDERNELDTRLRNRDITYPEREELHKEWVDVDCLLDEIEHRLQYYYKERQQPI